jgi:REP element-mobilizing transposase RayT
LTYDPEKQHRRSIRLKGYDYAQAGAYFVTICTHNRECLFGEVMNGEMRRNDWGQIVADEWSRSTLIRKEIELDAFVVMPNHMHGIVVITNPIVVITNPGVGATGRSPLPAEPRPHGPARHSLAALVAGFKSSVTVRINALRNIRGVPVWQRNYYEHIIRDEKSLDRIRQYVLDNPARWESDPENLLATTPEMEN